MMSEEHQRRRLWERLTLPRRPLRRSQAFTRVDLTVVLAILAFAGPLFLICATKVKGASPQAQCIENYRQLTRAWLMYINDHGNLMPPNNDGFDPILVTNWVAGNIVGRRDDSTVLTNPTVSLIAAYVKEPRLFKCPEDESSFPRSVSMNGRLNPTRRLGPVRWIGGCPYQNFQHLGQVRDPARIFVMIDERWDSINDAFFAIDMSNTGTPSGLGISNPYYFIDWPASYHDGGATVSFVDGHVEGHKWMEPTTNPQLGTAHSMTHTSASDRDIQWLQHHATQFTDLFIPVPFTP